MNERKKLTKEDAKTALQIEAIHMRNRNLERKSVFANSDALVEIAYTR